MGLFYDAEHAEHAEHAEVSYDFEFCLRLRDFLRLRTTSRLSSEATEISYAEHADVVVANVNWGTGARWT